MLPAPSDAELRLRTTVIPGTTPAKEGLSSVEVVVKRFNVVALRKTAELKLYAVPYAQMPGLKLPRASTFSLRSGTPARCVNFCLASVAPTC